MDEKRPTKCSSRLTVSLLIFLVLYSFFSFRKINQRLDSLNQAQTKEVRVAESNVLGAAASVTVPGYTETTGGAASSVIDASPATWWYGPTGKDPVSLTLKLSGQVPVGELDLTFLDGRQGTDYTIFFKSGDSWVTAKDVIGNKDQFVREVIDPTKIISTREVKISFYKTVAGDGLLGVAEIKVFKKL